MWNVSLNTISSDIRFNGDRYIPICSSKLDPQISSQLMAMRLSVLAS
jgi:hypothetical protein